MYTLTVKIAAKDTEYIDQETGEHSSSFAGHMWYSLSDISGSFGFAPKKHGVVMGDGQVTRNDDAGYQSTYYTGTIVINGDQYNTLQSWWQSGAFGSLYYVGGLHDCINFVWAALAEAGFNPGNRDGQFWPSFNADEVDKALYTYLLGSTSGWDESKSDAGNYHVIYGSSGNDELTIYEDTNAIYGGGGDDIINLTPTNKVLGGGIAVIDGGEGQNIIRGSEGADSLDLTNKKITNIKQVDMGSGWDLVVTSKSKDGPKEYRGGSGNDSIHGENAERSLDLYGDSGFDSLYGGKYDDTLDGGDDNDILDGGKGTDVLYGGAGNDILFGGDDCSRDRLLGGAGNDEYHIDEGDIIFDTDGLGTIYYRGDALPSLKLIQTGGSGFYTDETSGFSAAYDPGAKSLRVSYQKGSSPVIFTIENFSSGNFGITLQNKPAAAYDWSFAGSDLNDTSYPARGGIQNGKQWYWYLYTDADGVLRNDKTFFEDAIPSLRLTGKDGNDSLWGTNRSDYIAGGNGNDIVSGNTVLTDSNGQLQNFPGVNEGDLLDGGPGIDYVSGSGGSDTIFGGDNNDYLEGLDKNDVILGEAGKDVLAGGSDADILWGGDGDDMLLGEGYMTSPTITIGVNDLPNLGIDYTASEKGYYSSYTTRGIVLHNDAPNGGKDVLMGGAGRDWLTGGTGADVLDGGSDSDTLFGGAGDDWLAGGSGNDYLDGGTGRDIMIGGPGADTYVIDNAGDVVIDYDPEGTVVLQPDTLQGAVRMAADTNTSERDSIQAGVSYTLPEGIEDLTLTGMDNVDGTGNELDNVLTGNSGANILDGDAGADQMTGGLGDDTYVIDNTGDIVTENLNEGLDTVQSSITYTLGTDIENLTLTGFENINGTGNELNNVLTGNSGTNILDGGTGADTMSGGLGDDIYVVDNLGDIIIENLNEGLDTVQSSISYTLGANVENLTLTGSSNINGTGNEIDNILIGNGAANVLTGGAGNDTLNGGAGADTMVGGLGDDIYFIDDQGDIVIENAGEGTDTVHSGFTYSLATNTNIENLTLTGLAAINGTGNNFDNILIGNSTANILTGGGGSDTLDGGAGADTLLGGSGNDTYVIDNTGDVVTENAGEGTDTVRSSITYNLGDNIENLVLTGSLNINGTGNDLNNVLTGNSGANILDGGAGADQMAGGWGDDFYFVDNTDDVVTENAGEGIDNVQSSIAYSLGANIENLTLTGSSNINGTGNELDNVLIGNSGNNILGGGPGADTMIGGAGNDTYTVDSTADIVTENVSEGIDTVLSSITYSLGANVENLTLTGTSNINGTGNELDNVLTGNSAANLLTGGAGNDTLDGGAGADAMLGGLGNDTYIVDDAGDVVTENAGEGTDSVQSSITYSLGANIENLTLTGTTAINGTGNELDNILTGNDGDNILYGNVGNDELTGGAGNDYLNGGDGNDILQGGRGNDEMVGGPGDDIFRFNLGDGQDVIYPGWAGTKTLAFGPGVTLSSMQFIAAGYDLVIKIGDAGDQVILAGWYSNLSINFTFADNTVMTRDQFLAGRTVYGTPGNDDIHGYGQYNDIFDGGAGDDIISGNDGNDIIAGGVGNDILWGGAGDDTFRFNLGDGQDTIMADDSTGMDTLAFGPGITLSDLYLSRTGNDLIIKVGAAGDQVKLAKWYDGFNYRLDRISFASSGASLSTDQLLAQKVVHGTSGDDHFDGYSTDNDWFDGGPGHDYIYGWSGNDNLSGGTGDDDIYGGDGNDILFGGTGNDDVNGNNGDDSLQGGPGYDTLNGGNGNDTYWFNLGDGQDTIDNCAYSQASDIDTLAFGPGITLSDLRFLKVDNDLVIKVGDAGDWVKLKYWYDQNTTDYRLDNITFADNTTLTRDALLAKKPVSGTAGADIFSGSGTTNDWFDGGAGNDTINGNAGNDILQGGNGNDILQGGIGNDDLIGGSGDDIIRFNLGDGQDTLWPGYGKDTISFGADITLSNLQFYKDNFDLVIKVDETGDQVKIGDWYNPNVQYLLPDLFTFADNTVVTSVQLLDQKMVHGSDADDAMTGAGSTNDWFDGGPGDDTLLGGAGNDILIGGTGTDIISGGDGDDIFRFNLGDGQDTIMSDVRSGFNSATGVETLAFGPGISPSDLTVTEDGRDLVLTIGSAGDQIRLSDWCDTLSTGYRLNRFSFAGGSIVLNRDDLLVKGTVHGTTGADTLSGNGEESNWFDGGAGDDTLYGNNGDDILSGGSGDDIMYGGKGDDIFRFNLGDGQDTIVMEENAGVDTLAFGPGITLSDLRLSMVSKYDLVITVGNSGDQVKLANWNKSQGYYPYDPTWSEGQMDRFSFSDGTVLSRTELLAQTTVYGTAGNDVLIANVNDYVRFVGGAGDDKLYGGGGNHSVFYEDGTNILEGGPGNDTISGLGISSYRFNYGDGQDIVYTNYGDTLSFGAGITISDLKLVKEGDDLVIKVGGSGEQVNLWKWYDSNTWRWGDPITKEHFRMDRFRFADGTVLSRSQLTEQKTVYGTAGADSLWGYQTDNDRFDGGAGNDGLRGGQGNDIITGGPGDDVYYYNRGDGQDKIDDLDLAGGNDILRFMDIADIDIYALRFGNNLVFKIKNSTDQISFTDYYAPETLVDGKTYDHKINRVEFANSIVWDQTMIQTAVDNLATLNHAPTVNSSLPVLQARAGDLFTSVVPANTITDPDAWDSITYSIKMPDGSAVPAWLTFDAASRTLSGTPGAGDAGSLQFVLRGTDNYNLSAEELVTVNIASPNRAPVLSTALPDQTAAQGGGFSYTIPGTAFTDPDAGDVLSYSAMLADGSALPAWLSFNAATRTFSGTPSALGTISVRVNATDTGNLTTSDIFDITVTVQDLTLTGTSGADTLNGGAGNDTLSGLAGNDILNGNAGNDTLNGGTGNDTMRGGTGDDIYVVDSASDSVTENAGEGSDSVQASVTYTLPANVENLSLTGTAAINGTGNALDNVLTGNGGVNTLTGGAGNDTLNGGAGADKMLGGKGNDIYVLDNTGDLITENANEGTDTVQASVTYTLAANVENLTLTGTAAINGTGNTLNNVLIGNSAANTLNGGAGADSLSGGLGNDIYVVDNTSDTVTENLNEGTDAIQASVTYVLAANVENLTLTGTAAINGTGNVLDNILTGNSGVNTLTGGAGNDTLNGGAGADKMLGGLGNDIYIVDNTGDLITENAGEGTDTVQSSITYTLAANVENLTLTGSAAINGTGNTLDNLLTGNGGVNTLTGGAGNDTLNGGAGADKMLGGQGNDIYIVDNTGDIITENAGEGTDTVQSGITYTLGSNIEKLTLTGTSAIKGTGNTLDNVLTGNSSANTLSGGTGVDTLDGGLGNDTLTGGAGNDFFVFDTALSAATNVDSLTDFIAGQDKIRLDRNVFTMLPAAGVLSSAYFRSSANGLAGDGDDYFLYNTTSGALSYDADGNGMGVAVQFATLTTKPAITAGDFIIASS